MNDLHSNTHRIIRSKVNNENLSSKVRNLPLGHADPKVLIGFYMEFLDDEPMSIENDLSQESTRHETIRSSFKEILQGLTQGWST